MALVLVSVLVLVLAFDVFVATYFFRSAPRNDRGSSWGLVGRMKDAAVGEGERQVKYFVPACVPVCLPRVVLSHSTPSQVPVVPDRGPV